MLQRLEGGEHLVELHALLQIVERVVEHLLRHAEPFGCGEHARAVEHVVQQVVAAIGELLRRRAVEGHFRMAALVDHAAGR